MSKPWYYTIGYPVKVLHDGAWKNAIICDGYRHEDGIISTMTENGEKVWFGEPQKEYCLKPNLPDDNLWIPVSERMPDEFTNIDVWVSIENPFGTYTRKATSYLGKFWWENGKEIKLPVVAWKKRINPEPYKEVSEE
ncbi:MAG: hypothetical protein F8N38_00620 [Hungatella sp.]|nr:hypothetical protein [Hungatella sp.]